MDWTCDTTNCNEKDSAGNCRIFNCTRRVHKPGLTTAGPVGVELVVGCPPHRQPTLGIDPVSAGPIACPQDLNHKRWRVQCPSCKRTYKYMDNWMKHFFEKHT